MATGHVVQPTRPAARETKLPLRSRRRPGATLHRVVIAGPSHLFHLAGESLIPTTLVRGPWDHGLQHGGAVCGALGWSINRAIAHDRGGDEAGGSDDPRSRLCRLTVEILRPVPVAPMQHRASVVRRGQRSQVVDAELLVDGRLVARATSQWATIRPDTGSTTADDGDQALDRIDPAVPRRPQLVTDPGAGDIGYPRPGFNCDVFELRCLVGSTEEPGPGTVWARMLGGVVEGHPADPVDRLATVADLANAVGWDRSPNDAPMINPDLTLQLLRYPNGPWICLEAAGKATASGIGMMETTLWDGDGRFGRVLSTMVESPVALAVDL